MPKALLYITAKITWIFLFFGTDINENRAHVHVGKKSTKEYYSQLIEQWRKFTGRETIKMITIKK